jgi:hypothetical protein
MGLHMDLYKKTYIGCNSIHTRPEEIIQVEVRLDGRIDPVIQPHRVSSIQEFVAYWGNAFHINQWMMDNGIPSFPDFQEMKLKKIQELVELCKAIIKGEKDPKVYLPDFNSFLCYEGNDDELYGEMYYYHCQKTIDMLEPLLQEPESDSVFIYTISF